MPSNPAITVCAVGLMLKGQSLSVPNAYLIAPNCFLSKKCFGNDSMRDTLKPIVIK